MQRDRLKGEFIMVIIYHKDKETIVYPIERFDSIKVSVELFGIHADRTYTIIGVREISEHKDKKIVLGNYNEKKERDEAFDRFILALANGCNAYESIGVNGFRERLFRPLLPDNSI